MQLIGIAFLIAQAVLVQCNFNIELRRCSDENIKYIRNRYIRKIHSEFEDICNFWKPLLSCAMEVKSTLTLFRIAIERAKSNNNQIKNQCLDYLVVQSINIEEKYLRFLTGKCLDVGLTTKDAIKLIREPTLNIERCTKSSGECISILKCCKRVVDDADIKDEVKTVTFKYEKCYRRKCKLVKSAIALMWVGIAICDQLQNPSVSTETPTGLTETTPPLNTHPFFISTGTPIIPTTKPLSTNVPTKIPTVSTETHKTGSSTGPTDATPPLNTHPFFISTGTPIIPTTKPLSTNVPTKIPTVSTETHQTGSSIGPTDTTPPLNTHPFFIIPTTKPLSTDVPTEDYITLSQTKTTAQATTY